MYFLENRGHGSGQTEVKVQIFIFYYGAYWGQIKLHKRFFLSERSLDSNSKVYKCLWDGARQRSGQGQVAKGQLSKVKKHSHAAHVFRSSFKREFTCNGLKSVYKTFKRQIEWVRSRSVTKGQAWNMNTYSFVIHVLGHFSKWNSLVGVFNVYLRQVRVE